MLFLINTLAAIGFLFVIEYFIFRIYDTFIWVKGWSRIGRWNTTPLQDFLNHKQTKIFTGFAFFTIIIYFILFDLSVIVISLITYFGISYYYSPQEVEKRKQKAIQAEWERRQAEEAEWRRQAELAKYEAEQRRQAEQIRQAEQARYEAEQRRAVQERNNLQNRLIPKSIVVRTPDEKDSISKAGDMGEELLANAFISHGNFTGCFWWSSKRVKGNFGDKGPNEIDLIVLSHNYIYSLEAKHYAGTLAKNSNKYDIKHPYIRTKPKRDQGGKIVTDSTEIELVENFDDILETKVSKLKSYLLKNNVCISDDCFKRKVVFTNRNFTLDDSVKKDPRLICIKDLDKYLDSDGGTSDPSSIFITALIRHILKEEQPPSAIQLPQSGYQSLAANIDLVKCIDDLPSWDHLTYYGGKRIRGDFLSGDEIFEEKSGLEIFYDDCDIIFHCERDHESIQRSWDAGRKMQAEIVTANSRRRITRNLDYLHPEIKFHVVGDNKPIKISIYEIEKIERRGLK